MDALANLVAANAESVMKAPGRTVWDFSSRCSFEAMGGAHFGMIAVYVHKRKQLFDVDNDELCLAVHLVSPCRGRAMFETETVRRFLAALWDALNATLSGDVLIGVSVSSKCDRPNRIGCCCLAEVGELSRASSIFTLPVSRYTFKLVENYKLSPLKKGSNVFSY